MTHDEALILAMKHIEMANDVIACHLIRDEPIDLHDISTRLAAANYLVQTAWSGYRPDNFDEIIGEAEALDAGFEE